MKKPRMIEFANDWLTILRWSLLAVAPEEGCALLIGSQNQLKGVSPDSHIKIEMIWPCCNAWGPTILQFVGSSNALNDLWNDQWTKRTRFVIDPREQLHAQKWARERNLEVLGSAHSHPNGEGIPSSTDLNWASSSELMIIIDQFGQIRAWWLERGHTLHPKEVKVLKPRYEDRRNLIAGPNANE